MCLHCILFEDEVKPQSDMVDALVYSMNSKMEQPHWNRIELKGVGDNDGYWELSHYPQSKVGN